MKKSEAAKLFYLFLFSYGIDILSPIFMLFGLGSHNIFISLIITTILSLLICFRIKNLLQTIWCGILIFSHWILDFITWPMTAIFSNQPRMYLFPIKNTIEIGLGLYSSLIEVVLIEFSTLIIGIGIYLHWYRVQRSK
jgi:hypothetical protein